jgi:hypothetical protein
MIGLMSVEPRYTDNQLRYLGKKVQNMIGKDLKNLNQLRNPKEKGDLEDIQMDINGN